MLLCSMYTFFLFYKSLSYAHGVLWYHLLEFISISNNGCG